jgi:L-lactate dehydrogenase complex protein LldF
VKIDLPKLLLHLRTKVAEGDDTSGRSGAWSERWFVKRWAKAMRTRKTLEGSARWGRLLQRPMAKNGRIQKLRAPLISGWTEQRDFPALAKQSFAQLWREGLKDA